MVNRGKCNLSYQTVLQCSPELQKPLGIFMPLLGLITTKIICVFYGIGNILYSFLIINKTEIWALTHKKCTGCFWAGFSCYISLWCFSLGPDTPEDGSWVHLPSPPLIPWFELGVPAHPPQQSCSQALWAQASSQETQGWRDTQSQILVWIIFFLQLNWCSSMGRVCRSPGLPWEGKKLAGMKAQAVLPCIFSSELFLRLCLSSACEGIVSWCESALWPGLHVPFLPTCPILDNWGLLDLLEMCCV